MVYQSCNLCHCCHLLEKQLKSVWLFSLTNLSCNGDSCDTSNWKYIRLELQGMHRRVTQWPTQSSFSTTPLISSGANWCLLVCSRTSMQLALKWTSEVGLRSALAFMIASFMQPSSFSAQRRKEVHRRAACLWHTQRYSLLFHYYVQSRVWRAMYNGAMSLSWLETLAFSVLFNRFFKHCNLVLFSKYSLVFIFIPVSAFQFWPPLNIGFANFSEHYIWICHM